MIRRPPRSTLSSSSAASDVYKRQILNGITIRLSLMDRRGAANATIFDSIDIGMGVGSIIWGFVSQYEGFSAIYFGAAAVSVISVLLYLFILNRKLNLFSMRLV